MTTIAAAGTTFACRAAGEGPPAVMLHGFGMDSRMWEPVLARVDGRRCVAIDLRGAGATPPDPDGTVSLERHADDVAAMIATLGHARADIVGFSMGAFVLLALLERHPDVVASAVFVGARANADDAATRAGRDTLIRTLLEEGRGAAYRQLLPRLAAADARDHVRAQLRTMLEAQPYEGLIAALRAMRDRPDRLAVLSRVRVPTLVVAAEHDAFAPAPLPQQLARAAGAHIEVISGVGHTMPLEAPDTLASLITAFWASLGSVAP